MTYSYDIVFLNVLEKFGVNTEMDSKDFINLFTKLLTQKVLNQVEIMDFPHFTHKHHRIIISYIAQTYNRLVYDYEIDFPTLENILEHRPHYISELDMKRVAQFCTVQYHKKDLEVMNLEDITQYNYETIKFDDEIYVYKY